MSITPLGRPRRTLSSTEELCEALGIAFSDEQLAAITAPLRPAVIIAGAGSGKTTVMAARVVWLVGTGQVAPQEVLGLTFTRKAAAELGLRGAPDTLNATYTRLCGEYEPGLVLLARTPEAKPALEASPEALALLRFLVAPAQGCEDRTRRRSDCTGARRLAPRRRPALDRTPACRP